MTGWISVEDELPDVGIPVLVIIEYQPEIIIAELNHIDCGWYEQSEYETVHGDASVSHSLYGYKVTHWMPLPEPPEKV